MDRRLKRILYVGSEEHYQFLMDLIDDFPDYDAYDISFVSSYDEACKRIETEHFDLFLIQCVVGEREGLDLIRRYSTSQWQTPFILISDKMSLSTMIEAARNGAMDYLYCSGLDSSSLEKCMHVCFDRIYRRGKGDAFKYIT